VKVVIHPSLVLLAKDSIHFAYCHLASLLACPKLNHFPIRTFSIRASSIRTVSNYIIIQIKSVSKVLALLSAPAVQGILIQTLDLFTIRPLSIIETSLDHFPLDLVMPPPPLESWLE